MLVKEFSPLFSAFYRTSQNPQPVFQNWTFGDETRPLNIQQGNSETDTDFAARLQTKLQTELLIFSFVNSITQNITVSTFTDGNKSYFVFSVFEIEILGDMIPTNGVIDYKDKDEETFFVPIPPKEIEFQCLCNLQMQADQNTAATVENAQGIEENKTNIEVLQNEFNNLIKIPNTYLAKIFVDGLGQA